MKLRATLLSITLCTTFAACDSSAPKSTDIPAQKLVGVFGSAPVSGLSYSTSSGSGKTDSAGRFEYVDGETVSFSIGSLSLGDVAGAESVTEFDLVPGAHMPTDALDLNRLASGAPERGEFSTAVNMVSLLQTLDADSDVTNGIAIDAELESQFGRHFVDLHQYYTGFAKDRFLLMELYSAHARGDLTPRAVVNHGRGLHAIGGPSIELSTSVTHIRTGEGSVDQRIDSNFNAYGRKTFNTVDDELDGIANRIDNYEFNVYGSQIRHDADYYGSGSINRSILKEYNEFGDETSEAWFNSDGDRMRSYRKVWSEEGRLIEREAQVVFNNSIEYWRYDGNMVVYERDTESDGTINEVQHLTLNDRGDILETLIDRNADGVFDEKIIREFSPLGLETLKQVDTNNDGTVEFESTCTYTSIGLKLDCVRQVEGVNSRTTQTFENGRLIVFEYDIENDGAIDYLTTLTHNANGQFERVEQDRGLDGSLNYIGTFAYNSDGQLIREERDTDANGTANFRADYAYDGSRKISYISDYNGDGSPEVTSTYSDWVSVESSLVN